MSPANTAWLANMRAEAASGALMVIVTGTVRGQPAQAIIFPDEIVGLADDELLALARMRLECQQIIHAGPAHERKV